MKKIICLFAVATLCITTSYANPYTRALQKARDARTQIENASNPDNYDENGNRKEIKIPSKQEIKKEIKKEIREEVKQEIKKNVKVCVCPNCKLVYNAKLRVKHSKGHMKYVAPKCPCLNGGKCPTK